MTLDRFDCYEACVQNPPLCCDLLHRLHSRSPLILREDFSGSAALSRSWISLSPLHAAYAVDLDPAALDAARRRAAAHASDPARLHFIHADATHDLALPPPDVVFVGNFSIGEIPDRAALLRYLRTVHQSLAPAGVFICDTYFGSAAMKIGVVSRIHLHHRGDTLFRIHHAWEQRAADPISSRVENALHFRVEHLGDIVQQHLNAFIYRWRLWSPAELSDALHDAGFPRVSIHESLTPSCTDPAHFPNPSDPPPDTFRAACLCARTDP